MKSDTNYSAFLLFYYCKKNYKYNYQDSNVKNLIKNKNIIINNNRNKIMNMNCHKYDMNADFIGIIEIIDVIVCFCIFYHYHLHHRHRKAFRRKSITSTTTPFIIIIRIILSSSKQNNTKQQPLVNLLDKYSIQKNILKKRFAGNIINPTKSLMLCNNNIKKIVKNPNHPLTTAVTYHFLIKTLSQMPPTIINIISLNLLLNYFKIFFIITIVISFNDYTFSNYYKLVTSTSIHLRYKSHYFS